MKINYLDTVRVENVFKRIIIEKKTENKVDRWKNSGKRTANISE